MAVFLTHNNADGSEVVTTFMINVMLLGFVLANATFVVTRHRIGSQTNVKLVDQ